MTIIGILEQELLPNAMMVMMTIVNLVMVMVMVMILVMTMMMTMMVMMMMMVLLSRIEDDQWWKIMELCKRDDY